MNILNVICPWCGRDNDVEPEDASNDELKCTNCGELLFDEEGANEEEETSLMNSAVAVLTQADVDILDGSINRSVRTNDDADTEVKRLYHIYKSL